MMSRRLFLELLGGAFTLPLLPSPLFAGEATEQPESPEPQTREIQRYQEAYLYPYGELVMDIAAAELSIAREAASLGFAKAERLIAELGFFMSGNNDEGYSENSAVLKRFRSLLAAEAVFVSEVPGLSHPVLNAWRSNGLAMDGLSRLRGIRELSAAFIVDEVSRTLTGCGAKEHLVLGFNVVRARGLDEFGRQWRVALKSSCGQRAYFNLVGMSDLALSSATRPRNEKDQFLPLNWGCSNNRAIIQSLPEGCEPDTLWTGGRSALRAALLAQSLPVLSATQRMLDLAEANKFPLHTLKDGTAASSPDFII